MENEAHEDAKSAHEFVSAINALKNAEAKSAKEIENAKEEAERIIKSAKEKTVNMASKANDDSVTAKNAAIAKGRKDVEKQVAKLVDAAHSQAQKISAKKIDGASASSLTNSLLKESQNE